MSKEIKNIEKVGFQLRSIELLKGSIEIPPQLDMGSENFTFNITLEDRPDSQRNLIFVIVSVSILSEKQDRIMGSLSVSCIYEIEDFNKVMETDANGQLAMQKQFADLVHSLSISTTRGVMFSTYKGTFLHNAILPIIDPRSLQRTTK